MAELDPRRPVEALLPKTRNFFNTDFVFTYKDEHDGIDDGVSVRTVQSIARIETT